MKAYIQIKKLFSEKKQKEYTSCILTLGDRNYYFNLPLEAQSIILNKSLRDVLALERDFESEKFEVNLGD